jgi:probable HAF family extracellular repeat protein
MHRLTATHLLVGLAIAVLLESCGSGDNGSTSTPTPTPQPTVTLTTSASSVAVGSSLTLTWSSTNATSCTASGNWTGSKPASGSEATGPLNADVSYTLSCTGAGGSASGTKAVTVSGAQELHIISGSPPNGAVGVVYNSGNGQTCAPPQGSDTCFPCFIAASNRICPADWRYQASFSFRAAGGTPPYQWAAASLPAELRLFSNGSFRGPDPFGKATVPGIFTFIITVTDSASPANHASGTYRVVIAAQPPIMMTTPPPSAAAVRLPYRYAFRLASGGQDPLNWSETGALPPGLAKAQQEETELRPPTHSHYELIDLGTLGGPESFASVPLIGYAPVLNNSGTVIGYANTSRPDPHLQSCFEDCLVGHAFRSTRTLKSDLRSLQAEVPTSSRPTWIAENGLIAGVSQNGRMDPLVPGLPESRAVLWGEHAIDLGTLQGGHESVANSVNNAGQVVGLFTNTIPDVYSMFGSGFQTRAFSWKDGRMQDLGTLGGADAQAFRVNERGQVAGQSYLNSDFSSACAMAAGFPVATGVFLWENGYMQNLGSLGGSCTVLGDLNDRGQVVGFSYLPDDQTFHAFLWEDRQIQDLGNTFGGPSSNALAVNEAGHAVGWGQSAGDTFVQHASLWKDGAQTDLSPGGSACAFAVSINSRDQIVGSSYADCDLGDKTSFRGFIYENGGLVDLNSLIVHNRTLHISLPDTINDRGEIAGTGETADGQKHAFLLIPIDDCDPSCQCSDECCGHYCESSTAVSEPSADVPSPVTVNTESSNSAIRVQRPAPRYFFLGSAASTAPANLAVSAVNTYQLKLNWTMTSGQKQTGFGIYRCRGCSSPRTAGTKIASVGPGALSYIDGSTSSPLTQTTTYSYQVVAVYGAAESIPSKTVTATTHTEAAPTNLTSRTLRRGNEFPVFLSWNNSSTDSDSLHVERCKGSTCTNFSEIARIAGSSTTYLDGLEFVSHQTFRYRVRSHSAGGYSAYSNIRTQTLL